MIPNGGTIYLAPFSDSNLWAQTNFKVRFWEQPDFHGIDFSALARDAKDEIFAQPVVGYFNPRILLAPSCSHHSNALFIILTLSNQHVTLVDFSTISIDALKNIHIPISWVFPYT